MWPNPQETADLVTFTEEILNEKLHFVCRDRKPLNKRPKGSLDLRNSLKREPFQIFLYMTLLWRKSRTYYQFVQSWSLSFNVRFENKIQRQKRISENLVVFSRFNISLSFNKERKQWKFYSTLFNEIENLKYWKPFYMIFEYFILLSNNPD